MYIYIKGATRAGVSHADDFTANAECLQRSRGVGCWLGWSRMALMASDVAVILRGEGEMVAGVTVKSRVKPRAVKVWMGSRTHFF